MTKEEVKALIKAKIEGQGTAIDASSVLPAILNGIMDLIDEGGGGGTSDAVQYIPQELTEAQQMQARKNQGLYYTEGTPAGVITWDGNTEEKEKVDLDFYSLYKIADAPADLPGDKIIKVLNASNEEFTFGTQSMNPTSGYLVGGECTLGSEHGAFFIANNPHLEYPTPFEGLIGIYVSDNVRTIEYDAYGETIHQIPSEYLEDAVLYSPQTLTESEQMRARKNLDLYNTMTEVVTDDFAGQVYRIEVDPSTGRPFFGWAGEYAAPGYSYGFASAGISIPSGYSTVSKNGFTINGKEPVVSSGENWQMMVDPDNNEAILVETTAENVIVNTRFGSIVFEYPGLYASAVLEIYNESDYYGCTLNSLVNSFSENRTITTDVVSQIPYKYIPTQSVGSSADNQHFPTAKNVYDYVRNNSGTGAVRYDVSQSLSSVNQMRARKNQGLYYKETESASRTYAWRTYDGNPASGYGSVTVGDFIYVNLTGGGFPGSNFTSFGLTFGNDVVVGTDVVRRQIHNASGSMGYFYANEANSPALVIEAYEGCQYEGQSFSDGVWVLSYDAYDNYATVNVLYINGKPYTAYNKVGADLIESLNININYDGDNDVWTSNLTYPQIHKALKKNMPVLASMTKSGLTQYTENITDLCDSANDGPFGKLCIVFENGVDNWNTPQYYKKTIVWISEEDGVAVKEVKLALYAGNE